MTETIKAIFCLGLLVAFLLGGLAMDYGWKKQLVRLGHAHYDTKTAAFTLNQMESQP